jgi:septum formation protein
MKLILASQSPYRRQQLENLGVRFESQTPLIDEDELKKTGPRDLFDLTRYLAEKKAGSLCARFPEDVLLGSDQLVDFGGERLDKPGSVPRAEEQLKRLSGKSHRLITSLCIRFHERTLLFTDVTTIHFKVLNDAVIKHYVQLDNPIDCAGAYKIEKGGLALIEKIASEDPSAIQGLPLMSLIRGLEQCGLNIESFWKI